MTHGPRRLRLLALVLAPALASACITRPRYETAYDVARTKVRLRSESRLGNTVERGFDHPATISSLRLAHILSSIDVRGTEGDSNDRRGAIPLTTLFRIADGVSATLAQAGPDQEVVVQSIDRRKKTGIFDHWFLTSFVTYVQDDQLIIHLSHLDHEVERPDTPGTRIPVPRTDKPVEDFRVLPSPSITPVGPQVVAVDWRDPVFRLPTRIRTLPGGKVVRREVLMESPVPEDELPVGALPANLAPDTLRALADLEEERRSGTITESEYNTRRREILNADPTGSR